MQPKLTTLPRKCNGAFYMILIHTIGMYIIIYTNQEELMQTKVTATTPLFKRDFTMVVIGQIISLFGNAIIRYALPLYLLNQTHSPALFGIVSALSFLPMIFFAPIGGILADRVNKRNVMVILDFFTAAITLTYSFVMGSFSLVPLLIAVMMIFYAIYSAYQPAVQASIPVLAAPENLNSANAVINMVSSLAGLIGPALGGIIFASFGLMPILYIGAGCFACSAIMEIFIHIPFKKVKTEDSVFKIAKNDIISSLRFIKNDKPIVAKVSVLIAVINCFFSALIIVGVPVIVTERMGFSQDLGNQLYGYAQAALALGGLFGGLFVGIFGRKLKVENSYKLLFLCSFTLIPIALATAFKDIPMLSYVVIVVSCVLMMFCSTVFSIVMMAYLQKITPENLIGKVIALVTCVSLCSNPLGQLLYGFLFDNIKDAVYLIFAGALALCIVVSIFAARIIKRVND